MESRIATRLSASPTSGSKPKWAVLAVAQAATKEKQEEDAAIAQVRQQGEVDLD